MAAAKVITLLIPESLAGYVVQGYKECGAYITGEVAAKRKQSQAKRIKKQTQAIAACTIAKEKALLENQLTELRLAQTHLGNRTNSDRKAVGIFLALKAITGTGCLVDFTSLSQTRLIEKYTKKDFKTVLNYIDKLSSIGLCSVVGRKYSRNKTLRLASWEKLCGTFDIAYTQKFTTYQYDLSNPLQTTDYILDAVEVAEKQTFLAEKVVKKIKRNHRVTEFLKQHFSIDVVTTSTVTQIEAMRQQWFVSGYALGTQLTDNDYFAINFLYKLNTNLNRTRSKLKQFRNALKPRTISYLKAAMHKRGVAVIENCTLASNVKNRVPERHIQANGFNLNNKQTTWYLPSNIIVANCKPVAA